MRSIVLGSIMALVSCPECFIDPAEDKLSVLRYYILTFFLVWEFSYYISTQIHKRNKIEHYSFQEVLNILFKVTLVFIPINLLYTYFRFKVIAYEPERWGSVYLLFFYNKNLFLFIGITLYINLELIFFALKDLMIKSERIEKEKLNAELKALKYQLNPHFLFNNLNILSQLVNEDPKLAEKFINRLSKVYRILIEKKNEHVVPIEEELKFLDAYFFLINVRFKDSIRVELDKDNFSQFHVVPLVLQMLVENAIKHNEFSHDDPLFIHIYRETDYLVTENNAKPKKAIGISSGIGLRNIIERYRLVHELPVQVMESQSKFIVKVPIVKP